MRTSSLKPRNRFRGRLFPSASLLACAAALGSWLATAAQTPSPAAALRSTADPSLRHEVQRAIDKGQAWLLNHQNTNGFWSTPDYPALTALALTALNLRPGGQDVDSARLQKG